MTAGKIKISGDPQYALASPFLLRQREKAGLEPAAEMHVHFQHGTHTRLVTVELDESALMDLITAAASALRLLRAGVAA